MTVIRYKTENSFGYLFHNCLQPIILKKTPDFNGRNDLIGENLVKYGKKYQL